MTTRATITGWGKCRPPVSLSNHDLEQLVDTDHHWIVERTGIRSRGINHTQLTDMAEVAGWHALASAGLDAVRINFSHSTHEHASRIIELARSVSEETGRPIVDHEAHFQELCPEPRCQELLYPDQHPRAEGYRIMAETLVETLRAEP